MLHVAAMMSRLLAPLILALAPASAMAETYRSVPVSKLEIDGDKKEIAAALAQQVDAGQLRLLDARLKTETYLTYDDPEVGELPQNLLRVVFKGESELPLEGALELAMDYSASEVKTFRFTLPKGSTKEIKEEDFELARRAWAQARAGLRMPGGAWFSHQANHGDGREMSRIEPADMVRTFDIFSGGRAIADNLALNRDLILGAGEKDDHSIRIDTIEGVTVKAINWSEQLPKGEVVVDSLAHFIPEDQHAMFAPSLHGLLKLMKQLEGELTPVAGMISSDGSYRGLLQRYRRQLGMDLGDAAALLLPVRTVAVTGGDPYFATGTDVAVLMETDSAGALFKALELAVQAQAGGAPKRERAKALERVSFVIPEKGISSHLCRMGDLVFVTNSMAQVRRILEVVDRRAPALGKSDEFKVFRHRYPKAREDAFIFLSDATIRRWAGPVTRIGASRRNRALAALNELSCRGIIPCGKEDDFAPLLGRVAMLNGRAISENYGSAEFLTPISELGLSEVSVMEKQAYELWRRGYESGWRQVFDPIAIQLKLSETTLDLDLTVLPLNVNSGVREIMAIAGSGKLTAQSRMRPEGSVMRLACALDPKSRFFEQFDQQLLSMMPELKIKPLSWVGESVSVDFLESLYWEGLGQLGIGDQLAKMPVMARIEVKSKLKLGLFLTAMRTLMQTSAPDTFEWINRKHGERTYVVIAQREENEFDEPIRICYAIVGNALWVTLSETELKRAIDLELMKPDSKELATLPDADSLLLDADPALMDIVDRMSDRGGEASRMAVVSWQAIPILNEWRLRFPDRNPLQVHRELFGVSLDCPGGNGYRWNEAHLTMESVVYGHRGAPREPGGKPQGLAKYGRVHSGIDFEDDGLRLRLHLGPAKKSVSLPQAQPGKLIGNGAEFCGYRQGRILHYSGKDPIGQRDWRLEVLSIEKSPEGLVVTTSEPWSDEEGEGTWKGRYLIAESGTWELGGKDEFTTTTYPRPVLNLPAQLRLKAVHHSDAAGEDVYEQNAERVVDRVRMRSVLKVVGIEDVEVTAGKFKDCVVIERRSESMSGDYFERYEAREWYHSGTGLIREVDQHGFESQLVKIEEKK